MSVKRQTTRDRRAVGIPVDGVGASGGGLAALEVPFSGVPATSSLIGLVPPTGTP